ncbi:hypothetical protein FBEOM_12653 [Fusarium beomiforme]|uniref:DUF8035 domain-containing protein n=1 Tax=Fusarium beomiforme TaxID=44412 RepID=A0A9P5A7U2_9HYPO|nr:hypothetical protein FBEOM_12653 [Fusarium beomiforme]
MPSSQSSRNEPVGIDLPGTELKCFDEPISERLKARFFDIKVLYTQPLLDYILKRKRDPGDISMKLKYLGLNLKSIQLHIVIQCDRRVAKRVRKFFAQAHVEEELLPDFKVFVLEKALLRLMNDEAIEVLVDSIPKETWCGTPIRLVRGNMSVMATFGGVIVVETSYKRLFGLTAAHSLKKLHGPLPNQLPPVDSKHSLLSSSSDVSESDSDSDSISTISTESSSQHLEVSNDGGMDTIASRTTFTIGTVICDTLNTPIANNYDWAIIDLNHQDAMPNRVVLNQQPDSSDFEEETTSEPILSPGARLDELISRQVLVLTQGRSPIGELSLWTSSIMISPSSSFVEVHDLTMKHGSSLNPGDSGSWVVDAKTSKLYGHVVSVDAFGEAQVMPIQGILRSIRYHMNAKHVWLPTSEEIQLLQGISRSPLSDDMAASPVAEGHENEESTTEIRSEDMAEEQSHSSLRSTGAYGEASSEYTVPQQDIVAQRLQMTHENPEGATYPSIRQILESALEEIWTKVQNQPNSYIMTRDEFAVFNFFQDRFTGDTLAVAARKRYWTSLSVDSSQPTWSGSSHLDQLDAILRLVSSSYRRIGAYGSDFAEVATKLYNLATTLVRLRDEVVHIKQSYSLHLHSLIEDWDLAIRRINAILDTHHEDKKVSDEKQPHKGDGLRPIESSSAGKKMAIELLLDSIQLQNPQFYDKRQADLEDIKDKVDLIATHLFANREAGSISGENDDLWRHFQVLLEKEGFSPQVLTKNKDVLMTYINDLEDAGGRMTTTLSNTSKPLDQPQNDYPWELGKPENNLVDTEIETTVMTTLDIQAPDLDARVRSVRPPLSPRTSQQRILTTRDLSTETSCPIEDCPHDGPSQTTHSRDNGHPGLTLTSSLLAADPHGRTIPIDALWTKVSRKLVSAEVLERAGVRYEARSDYVAILGVLSQEQVAKLVGESKETMLLRPPSPCPLDGESSTPQSVSPLSEDESSVLSPDDNEMGISEASFDSYAKESMRRWLAEERPEKSERKQKLQTKGIRQRTRILKPVKRRSTKGRLYLGGFQQSIRAYDKGGPSGIGAVGIGSAAVSLLNVLSEASSAI